MKNKNPSQFYLRSDGESAVAGCYCDELCSCPFLHLRRNGRAECDYDCFIEARIETRHWFLKARLQAIWDLLRGKPTDFFLSMNWVTVQELGTWLLEKPDFPSDPTPEEKEARMQALMAWYRAGMPELPEKETSGST